VEARGPGATSASGAGRRAAAEDEDPGRADPPFCSPLVAVARSAAPGVPADNGPATLTGTSTGTLRIGPYLDAAQADRT
jgi:hypothetical protein